MSLLLLDVAYARERRYFRCCSLSSLPYILNFNILTVVRLVVMYKQLLLSISYSLFSSVSSSLFLSDLPNLSPSSFLLVSINSSLHPLLIVFSML